MFRTLISFIFSFTLLCHSAKAESCTEYFTSVWGNPLDMTSAEDILTAFPASDRSQVTDYAFSNGEFSLRTTGTDPWFLVLMRSIPGSVADETTRYGDARPINPSTFTQARIRMFVTTPSVLQVIWNKANGDLGGSDLVPTVAGWQTYVVNLNVSNWSGSEVQGIRIDPTTVSGEVVKIDFIQIVPAGCDSPELRVVTFRQPDREGGEDFFVATRQNPANFNSAADIAAIGGNSSANILPSNSYQDSASATRRGDYLEAVNTGGDGDPNIHLVYPGIGSRIDATRYKIACWTVDILRPITEFHSVVRLLWRVDGDNKGTDDFVTKFNGEARYCTRMDTVPLEPALGSGQQHPWRNNSSGEGLDFLRFDPHEEGTVTPYRLNDFRLATEHEADKKFTIVVSGERQSAVELLYKEGSGSFVPLTSLAANRSTDVVVWNTEALAPGKYTLQARVGLTSFNAPETVTVTRSASASDTINPILQVDGPLAGHQFDGSLQLVGYSLDNRRLAAVEAHLDGVLLDSFLPSNFDARARDAQPTYPYGSEAGFNSFLDTSAVAAGAHTLTVSAYDTAGNVTTYSAAITKVPGATPAEFLVPFAEGSAVAVPNGVGSGTPGSGATKAPRLSVKLRGAALEFKARANGTCSNLRILAASSKAALSSSPSVITSGSGATLAGRSAGLARLRGTAAASRVFFGADCGGGTKLTSRTIDGRSIASRKRAKSVTALLSQIVSKFKAS